MSKLRDEERAKRNLQEENDILLAVGEEGKKGDKAFKEYTKIEEKVSKAKRDITLEEINKRRNLLLYHKYLADLLFQRLYAYVDIARGWKFETMPSEKGVVMELKSPDGRIFRSAFAVTKNPELDLNAIENFAIRADNTMERVENEKYKGIVRA